MMIAQNMMCLIIMFTKMEPLSGFCGNTVGTALGYRYGTPDGVQRVQRNVPAIIPAGNPYPWQRFRRMIVSSSP